MGSYPPPRPAGVRPRDAHLLLDGSPIDTRTLLPRWSRTTHPHHRRLRRVAHALTAAAAAAEAPL